MNGENSLNIYIATPLSCAWLARELAKDIKAGGYNIVSQWHDTVAPDAVDPRSQASRARIVEENLGDLERADVLVLDLRHEDTRPRATYGEAGWALRAGKKVVWLYDGAGSDLECILDAHPNSVVVRGEFQLANALKGLAS